MVTIRTNEIDFDHGLIKIGDEKKDRWRHVMPTTEVMGVLKRCLNALDRHAQYLFPLATKTVERIIQCYSRQALGFVVSGHSLRTTCVSRAWNWSRARRW